MIWVAVALAQDYRAPFGDSDYSAFYPTAYYDHSGVDWACGSIRYSGHRGSDFGGGSWSGMAAGRDIVAAADGVVEYTNDGEYDECSSGDCSGGSGYGNYVKLRHEDGKYTYYAHLKKWTVAVSVGQTVSCGQKLGEMGSSGYSTGPHLHFESRTSSGSRVDPFDGSCSSAPSYWTSQGSHGGLPGRDCDGPAVVDNDGDGYPQDEDCDDSDKSVHPGATEICDDGKDNDCSGGDKASSSGYDDDDGDGYGDHVVTWCNSKPADAVSSGGDCDDGEPAVNPGADELCDGLDNDCDGEIDDGPPTEMSDPPPAASARLVDWSAPAALRPGESAEVWFLVENVGTDSWTRRGVWMVTTGDEASPLATEDWPAWNVLAVLDEPVAPGEQAVLRGRIRLDEDATGRIAQDVRLTVDGEPVRCPAGDIPLVVHARARGEQVEEPDVTGCAHAPAAGLGVLLLVVLGTRRRCS